jgi:hypothetical protein
MAYTHSWLAKDLIVDAKNRIKKKKRSRAPMDNNGKQKA